MDFFRDLVAKFDSLNPYAQFGIVFALGFLLGSLLF